ncbi:3,4-dihydroxy-2-butanone-4-phosphate synthase [Paenirhodobacter populi]|uniref:3,4-dihydroxy-2-butanone 4-phosphate synthase n=1 Tax=Paenirhodobacter populi TaxID=2306993 RepID=A0A443ILD3_9RHOB|nr:3,4-dihydroxy-2-butanone-4-phosphate synthase [Sinirhodobacter populi]RWR05756.1 3,4-dihydroxy-2-butanone-4-phosphate synthase [Sinirhodobacter populi]
MIVTIDCRIEPATEALAVHAVPHEADPVNQAIEIVSVGGIVIVVDNDDRENEGDLIASAQSITPEMVAFMVNHTTGILCAAMDDGRADALDLPPMVARNNDPQATAFTVTCDAVGCGTGVSASDRTLSFRALSAATPQPGMLRRPGHIFPLRARRGGVLTREGHTEAAWDLVRLAGHVPVGVLGELVNPDGTMMRGEQIAAFARRFGLKTISVAQMIEWRRARGDI